MIKQACGIASINPWKRNDTIAYRLWYPQVPLVSTRVSTASHTNDLPTGQNLIVAVLAEANNQEDAIVMAVSSLDFGVGRTFYDRTQRDEDGGTGNARARFEQVDESRYDDDGRPIVNYKHANYQTLGEDGIVDPSAILEKNDCLVGKRERTQDGTRDLSTFYKGREQTQVESVRLVGAENGRKAVMIKMATQRRPQIGDKFSSRHGQKGVIGDEAYREDMPFTADGVTPDIVINPHGQPSRMTVGQMIEGVAAKIQAMHPVASTQANGTAFENYMMMRDGMAEIDIMNDILQKMGFKVMGHEQIYSGVSGQPLGNAKLFKFSKEELYPNTSDEPEYRSKRLEAAVDPSVDNGTSIFPIYYQPLRHVAKDKLGARQRGPYHPVHLQPVEGRSRNGGLRFGEMEKDALASYGAARTLRGRLFNDSDAFPVVFCESCHREGEHRGNQLYCRSCNSYDTCVQTYLPRGFHCKYFSHLLDVIFVLTIQCRCCTRVPSHANSMETEDRRRHGSLCVSVRLKIKSVSQKTSVFKQSTNNHHQQDVRGGQTDQCPSEIRSISLGR
jgi:DNA-directed RNA polymerase beta subunit